jgi:hypothetical protein
MVQQVTVGLADEAGSDAIPNAAGGRGVAEPLNCMPLIHRRTFN